MDIHVAHTHLMTDYQQAQTLDASQELYNRMAIEIMKSVNFYNYNNREQSLRSVYLCGGGAAIPQIHDAIRQLTDLEVTPISALLPEGVTPDTPYLYPRAIGCALQD